MAQYMIHACPQREWYVNEYLVPSMLAQGIREEDIIVYVDDKKLGNLNAFLDSLQMVAKPNLLYTGTWHLQDDVIISSDFKRKTELYDTGTVHGFASEYDKDNYYWWSFPCIRIPNTLAYDFLRWIHQIAPTNQQWKSWIAAGKYDDALFKDYCLTNSVHVKHLNPNIVDHVDWAIGGSTVNIERGPKRVRSVMWKDEQLVIDLCKKLGVEY